MNVLIVGAGAVGTIYGAHLHRSGVNVTYLVKPKHLESLQTTPIRLFCHNRPNLGIHPFQNPPNRFITLQDLPKTETTFDAVIITTSSTALRNDPQWINMIVETVADEDTVFFVIPPAEEDIKFLNSREIGIPLSNIVRVTAAIISYQAPLPNAKFEPKAITEGTKDLLLSSSSSAASQQEQPIIAYLLLPKATQQFTIMKESKTTMSIVTRLAKAMTNTVLNQVSGTAREGVSAVLRRWESEARKENKSIVKKIAGFISRNVVGWVGDQTRMYVEDEVKWRSELGVTVGKLLELAKK
ncbi:hypothetical protein HDU76_010383 [Blyttiomyces sp. JEL0837]|nr:hypothetical protein HDU76_010383 [Blyttiomyces sp. JEL0837]